MNSKKRNDRKRDERSETKEHFFLAGMILFIFILLLSDSNPTSIPGSTLEYSFYDQHTFLTDLKTFIGENGITGAMSVPLLTGQNLQRMKGIAFTYNLYGVWFLALLVFLPLFFLTFTLMREEYGRNKATLQAKDGKEGSKEVLSTKMVLPPRWGNRKDISFSEEYDQINRALELLRGAEPESPLERKKLKYSGGQK